jgi:hypothetical protein
LIVTDKSNKELVVVEDDETSIPDINHENSTKTLVDKSSEANEDSQPDILAAKTSATQDDELSDSSVSCNTENGDENKASTTAVDSDLQESWPIIGDTENHKGEGERF